MAFELEKAPSFGAFFWLEKPTCLGAKPPNRTTESKIRCSEYPFATSLRSLKMKTLKIGAW